MNYHALSRHLLEFLLIIGITGAWDPPTAHGQDNLELAFAFTLPGASGEMVSLEQFRGQYVVLEWMNFRCREVDRLYRRKILPVLQSELKEKGIVWLSVISEAEGKQGQVPVERLRRQLDKRGGNQHDVLVDVSGEVGRAFGALVSPHMVLIDPDGMVLYSGALDNQPEGEVVEGPAINYVEVALNQSLSDQPVQYATTEAYGCPIKYMR